jgi:hypothetical protein
VRGEGRCFFGWRRLCRIEPSGISRGDRAGAAGATLLPVDVALFQRGTSMRPMFRSPRCLPPEETTRALLRGPGVERCSRRPTRATAARVHRCSKERRLDLSPPAFAREIEAACAAPASADVRFHEHDCGPLEHPDHRICGRATALLSRVTSVEGNHRMGTRSEAEENRSSALPAAIARHGDFAPTSTVSGASCRGHPSLALSGVTRGERDTAIASRACRARERQGRATPSFREETRRSPARGTFHHEIVR